MSGSEFEGIDPQLLKEAADRFGTPCFIFSPERLQRNIVSLREAFSAAYANFSLCYAVKTNFLPTVVLVARAAGAHPEVIGGLEFDLAENLGLVTEHLVLNGPLKTVEELTKAARAGAVINVDNRTEFDRLNQIGCAANAPINCGIRIKSGESTAWSRFGFDLGRDAETTLQYIKTNLKFVNVRGVHFHMGTNNNEPALYEQAARSVYRWASDMHAKELLDLEYIDMGGGFSSNCPLKALKDKWKNPSDQDFAAAITAPFSEGILKPRLIIEPGRRLVDDCFIFLTKAEYIVPDNPLGIVIDGSVTMFPSAAHRAHRIDNLTATYNQASRQIYNIFGASPMHTDCLGTNVELPETRGGDIIAIQNAGAYSMNMAMSFSKYRPPVIRYENGSFEIVRRREKFSDVFGCDSATGMKGFDL